MIDGHNCTEQKFLVTNVTGTNFHCAVIDQFDCEIYFNFTLIENEKFVLHVRNLDPEKDCPKPVNVLLVTGSVFAALFVVGIILISLYLLTVYLTYKAEYNRFLQAKRNARPGVNPLVNII
uniref:Integrin beta-6 (Trinotate prediction) n=1 Tax=Myxobolus squamalis TaxID=59785 RepID=A0A6B2FXN7_MYXSQ